MYRYLISFLFMALLLGCQKSDSSKGIPEGEAQLQQDSTQKSFDIDMAAIDKLMSKSQDSITVATVKTKDGDIEIELYTKDAPKTTANFIGLSLAGYYNGVIFHRIAKGYVIQGGDPTGTGAGGSSIYGGPFEDELNPNTQSYKEGYTKGVVAMANRGPNTNTSQFFIILDDAPQLPKNYTIFGRVIKGMNVVNKIASGKITPERGPNDGRPVSPVAMEKVTVEKRFKKVNSIFETR
ncbi:MAG TPA: peptidylprolyl isomerase [Ignavibacteriales bacterium]|nr:peptidylprolyl isomerase [Ignavibacteriales bacterium]